MAGRFITFEGGEGAGKSTQIVRLRDRLARQGIEAVTTREPGGSPQAERIRALLLGGTVKPLGPFAEAVLFASARADHISQTIRPALDRGAYVLCDRFVDSTRVYQGFVGEVDIALIRALERATVQRMPDLTLILDIPAPSGLLRAETRRRATGQGQDRYEKEALAFHEAVRDGFLRIARDEPDRCAIISAQGAQDDVDDLIWREVERRLLQPEEKSSRNRAAADV